MTPEDYYLEQREQVHDDVVNLQEKALRLACKECGLTEEIDEFEVISSSDEIAKTAWYKGMYAKRVKFECSELNLTFFYDAYGIATYTYAGFSSNADTLENITKAFAKAEQLRIKMDEIMERMIEEKDKGKEEVNCQEKEDKKTGFIGKKYSDTKFVFGEVRSQLDMKTFEVQYVACATGIDLANYSLNYLNNVAMMYFDDGIDEIQNIYKEDVGRMHIQSVIDIKNGLHERILHTENRGRKRSRKVCRSAFVNVCNECIYSYLIWDSSRCILLFQFTIR